jgi:hypothetical protein
MVIGRLGQFACADAAPALSQAADAAAAVDAMKPRLVNEAMCFLLGGPGLDPPRVARSPRLSTGRAGLQLLAQEFDPGTELRKPLAKARRPSIRRHERRIR